MFAEPQPSSDETAFRVDNTSEAYYKSPYYLLHQNQVQPIPPPNPDAPLQMILDDFVGPEMIAAIQQAGKIAFHAVGDTGAAKVNYQQTVAQALANEAGVADAMVKDLTGDPVAPSFFFHLGDIVYHFGEAQYYYDQFYEPFRMYDRPIFAIPGNHDGVVFGASSSAPQVPTLQAFLNNFCAASAGPSPDAGGLVRSAMTQPGVYFTLDAPFVSIIGLYSNVLEGPGVISSQKGKFPLSDEQLVFLKSELQRLKPQRQAGQRAVVLAMHHPPLSADAHHGGSSGLEADLDSAFGAAGFYPDLILSGHAHLYQRFTRQVKSTGQEIPYIVSGSGGFAATPPQEKVKPAPVTVGNYTMEIDPIVKFGYLFITCDAKTLNVAFRSPAGNGTVTELDTVTVDLTTGKLAMTGPAAKTKPRKGKAAPPAVKRSQPKARSRNSAARRRPRR